MADERRTPVRNPGAEQADPAPETGVETPEVTRVPRPRDTALVGAGRVRTAWIVALAADALQIVLMPMVMGGALSPVDDFIDVLAGVAMVVLLGWHWAFLPTFVAEIVPMLDLVPSWTLAVFIATRGRGKQAP
jgi:hypothetical protein